MRQRILYIIVLLISVHSLCGQTRLSLENLLDDTRKLLYSDPAQAGKIATYTIKNSSISEIKNEAEVLKAESEVISEQYTSFFQTLETIRNDEGTMSAFQKFRIEILKSEVFFKLGLREVALQSYLEASHLSSKIQPPNEKQEADYLLRYQNVLLHPTAQNVATFQQIQNKFRKSTSAQDEMLLNKGILLESNLNLQKQQIEKVFEQLSNWQVKQGSYFWFERELLLAKIESETDHDASISRLNVLLSAADPLQHIFQQECEWILAENYSKNNDLQRYSQHMQKFLLLKESKIGREQKARISARLYLDNLAKEYEKEWQQKARFTIFIIAILVAIVVIVFVLKKISKKKKRKKNFEEEERLKWMEDYKKEIEARFQEEKNTPFVIPEKTELDILEKLKDFEVKNRFLKPDLSLAVLAKEFNSNTTYLSEIINTHKGKNFKTYVNELRIDYIVRKLRDSPEYRSYKISYLAEESGFTSRTSFASIFKSVTQMTPSSFIESLQNKPENEKL